MLFVVVVVHFVLLDANIVFVGDCDRCCYYYRHCHCCCWCHFYYYCCCLFFVIVLVFVIGPALALVVDDVVGCCWQCWCCV